MRQILLALFLALPLPASAQPAGPSAPVTDLAAALALPVASELTGARDRPLFAWVENEAGARNIWLAEAGRPARRLTDYQSDDGQLVYHLALRPDGGALAFVRGGDPEYADEEDLPNTGSAAFAPKQQLFLADLAAGAARPIGEGHSPVFSPDGRSIAYTRRGAIWLWDAAIGARRIASVDGDVRRLQWAPDGSRLAFVDERGDRSFVALVGLDGGPIRYVDPGLGQSIEPAFSPDGRQIAFIFQLDPPAGAAPDKGSFWSIKVADAATGAVSTVWTAPDGIGGRYAGTRSRNLFWSATGRIVFPWERSGYLHPYSIDAGRGGAAVELVPGDIEVESFLVAPGGSELVFAMGGRDPDTRHIYRTPIGGGALTSVSGGAGFEFAPVFGGDRLAVIATDADSPAFAALAGDRIEPLGRVATLTGIVRPEPLVYTAEDGVLPRGQLFRPRSRKPGPALVFVHGGPRRQMVPAFHPSGYYSNAYILNQHLAARGYHVLAINYRSGTGYGRAFRDAPGIAREGATEYRDVIAAGRLLAKLPLVDPKRIGIWGGSWGGYLTALALARNSDVFAAGVDFHGVHAMVRPVENNLSPDAQRTAQQLQWQSSPMASLERWTSPVLLVHGDDDRNVPFSQSLLLARELAARGIPHRQMALPNERHGFFRYASWLAAYRETVGFFDERLNRR